MCCIDQIGFPSGVPIKRECKIVNFTQDLILLLADIDGICLAASVSADIGL